MEIKNYFAQDAQGNIMPSANCYLYLPGTTTLATGLVDGSGTPISNPFLASSIGQVTFGAPNGVYDLRISQGSRDTTIKIQCADLLQALNETASFLGAKSSAPTTRNDGYALQIADRYFNTVDQLEYLYKSTGWVANNLDGQLLATSRGASLLGALMQDGSPGTIQEAIDEGDNSLRQELGAPDGASLIGSGWQAANSIARLRKLLRTSASRYAMVAGYYKPGDGGGGMYYLDAEDLTSSENGGTVIVADDGGRWKLNHSGDVSVKQFGVKGDGVANEYENLEKALFEAPKFSCLMFPPGLYRKDNRNRIYRGTHLVLAPQAIVQRYGAAEGWMFVNGEVRNTTYATGYDGDVDIRVTGGKFDLGGYAGRSAAAFVLGHSRRVIFEHCHFYNGYDSHNIEINASADFLFSHCTFENQGYSSTTSSFEAVNVDSAAQAGFPGFGAWDDTPDFGGAFINCIFRNVQGGISSHGTPAGVPHTNIKIIGCTFENIATRAVRAQGWDESSVVDCWFRNIGFEAITLLTANRNVVRGNHIHGASVAADRGYSAIRIAGDGNLVDGNIIDTGGNANRYAYAIGIASGTRNSVKTAGSQTGVSGLVSDGGTLSSVNNRTLLFTGGGGTLPGTVIPLLDSLNNYDHLEVCTGQVSTQLYQSSISHPFNPRNWNPGSDFVGVNSAQGRWVGEVTALNSLTVTRNDDSLRKIYGIAA